MDEIFNLVYSRTFDQILESLKNSRSNVRSLQDRPIVVEQQSSPYNRAERMQSTQVYWREIESPNQWKAGFSEWQERENTVWHWVSGEATACFPGRFRWNGEGLGGTCGRYHSRATTWHGPYEVAFVFG